MTITLTREEAQQVLEHLDDLADFRQWDIDMHVTQYGEEYKPHRVKHMREQLANTNSTIETLRARLSAPEPEPPLKLGDMEQRAFDQECGFLSAAAPPQRKEWQGLTDEEMMDLELSAHDLNSVSIIALRRFGRAVEAKLRKKNT